jgi:hypothetical protein
MNINTVRPTCKRCGKSDKVFFPGEDGGASVGMECASQKLRHSAGDGAWCNRCCTFLICDDEDSKSEKNS